jgi:hypothetical protein
MTIPILARVVSAGADEEFFAFLFFVGRVSTDEQNLVFARSPAWEPLGGFAGGEDAAFVFGRCAGSNDQLGVDDQFLVELGQDLAETEGGVLVFEARARGSIRTGSPGLF